VASILGGHVEARNGILEWHFLSSFLGVNSSLLRLEVMSGFLP